MTSMPPQPRNMRTGRRTPQPVMEIDWPFFGELCRGLALKVFREFDPQVVIGIAKAGVIPGAVVASILQRDFASIAITRTETGSSPVVMAGPPRLVTGKRVPEDRKAATPSALPALTFYQELKAPLTAPPPAPKPTKTRPPDLAIAPPSNSVAMPATPSAPRSESASLPSASHAAAVPAPSTDKATRFTLQVGAYNARQPADTLRAM